jgi:hypothetical protein
MTQVLVTERFSVVSSRLWERVGRFASLGEWSPAVEHHECNGETPGSVRILHVEGGTVTEKLIEMNSRERFYIYSIEDSPLPVKNYQATIKVQDDGDGTCIMHWSSTFEPAGVTEAEAIQIIEGIYRSGLEALRLEFSG